jgi:hypothetical protein
MGLCNGDGVLRRRFVGDLILGLKNTYKLWDEVGCRVVVGKNTGEGKKGVEEQNNAVLWVLFLF